MTDAKQVFSGKHVVVLERGDWEFVERKKGKSAVAVAALTQDGKIVLTEQFRRPVNARVIDLPAGLVGDEGDDDAESTARKELEEETGYRCTELRKVADGPTSPGITSETVAIFVARGLERAGQGGGVGGEDITVHEVPLNGAEKWLHDRQRSGLLVDLKVWTGLYFLTKST